MAWFSFLKAEGYFNPDKNPEPILVQDRFQVPYWEALGYLEKLSIQIREGNEAELIDELLDVIYNVSKHPKDNFHTWYLFIKILCNISNEKIPIEILDFIPVWLSGRFDTMLQTSELCDNLLPKFLNEEPTKADIEKAELILHYLFQIEKEERGQVDVIGGGETTYKSRSYLHFLRNKFDKKNLATKIVRYCSSNFILELGRNIKWLLLDYPNGIKTIIRNNNIEYEIKISIEKENLFVSSKLIDNDIANESFFIANWENKNINDLKQELVLMLKQHNVIYTPNDNYEDTIQRLNFALNTDLTSAFGFNSIRKLDDKYSSDEKILNVFSLIFRDLLNEKAKQNPKETISLLDIFCYDKKYSIPFYKRIALYVICENWNATKSFFWKLVKNNDESHLFSKSQYQKEVYDLLHANQQELNEEEIIFVQGIIDRGEQGEVNDQDEQHKNYWQLRWYSALKDIDPFKAKYSTLSKMLNITNEHYENLGEIRMRSGSISPIPKEELLSKSNQEITEYIRSFNPKDRWEDINISGLSSALGSAIESLPEKFADEIELYQGLPYIYLYSILNAFGEAWKQQKSFDWEKVLLFCLQTLKNDLFYSGKLTVENDTWNATSDWVVGSIANLISAGFQNEKKKIESRFLSTVKEIIEILVSNLKRVDDFKGTNMEYPTYSLNSTAGKSLRALLDYSLYRASNLFTFEDKVKWEPEIRSLFEETLEKGILDGNILEGMYFEQLYFLDKDWITEKVKHHYDSGQREWLAFIGGIAFGKPPFNKDLYILFYPHYEKVIEGHIKLKSSYYNALTRHLTAFYFWGYETLSSQKLLFRYLNTADSDEISDLINFIWQQENYQKSLSEMDRHEFQQMIVELWGYLAEKYENSTIHEELKNLSALTNWIVFAPELNNTYLSLILKSSKYIDDAHSINGLLENLVRLKTKGNPNIIARSIGEILYSLNFKEHIGQSDKDLIKDLVSFLYLHGQNQLAISFSNKIASVYQHFFLREIYEANTGDLNVKRK